MTKKFCLVLTALFLYACKSGPNFKSKYPVIERDYNNLQFTKLPKSIKTHFKNSETTSHVLVDPAYYVWGTSVVKWEGKYHAYYSRWQKKYKHKGWLTYCEIVHAVSDKPEGPFEFVNVVLESEREDGWDVNNAHNPYAIVAEGKINLYYIANDIGHLNPIKTYQSDSLWFKNNRIAVRNSQCIGMASASRPEGPFTRTKKPIVKPDNVLFKNIAVNPAVVFHNNKYIMIMKGDDVGKEQWFRIQLVGDSATPEGPYKFQEEPVYDKAQTEDACIWYDQELGSYYMVCHVMGKPDLALFTSKDGKEWLPHERSVFMKKAFVLEDGTVWKPERVERPFVLTDQTGKPIMLYVAIADQGVNGNIAIPIHFGE